MLIKIISKQKNPYKQAGFIAVVIGLLVFGVVVTGTYAYKHRSFVLNKFKQVQNFSKSKTNPSEQLAKNTDEKAVSSKQEREPEGQVLSVVDNRSYINQAVMEEFQRLVAAGALTGPQGVKGEKGDKGENSETRNTSQNYPVGLPSNNLGQVLGATITATPSYNPPSPQGPTTTNIPSIQQGYVPAGLVPNNDQGFNGAVLGGFTSLGVKNITSDKITVSERVTTNNLTVSGSSSFAGDLSVTGSFSSGSLTATTAQVATGGKVVNLNVVTPTGGFQNDSQHWIDVGSDNLPRIVYFDTSSTRLRLLRCLNVNCSSSNITNIIDNEPNNVDAPVLVLGPDGFPRVAYITYDSPSELRFVKCNDADCATKTDNLIDVATSTGLTSYHILSIAIGSDGFARILYDNFAGTSALKLAVCNNAACTAPTLNTIATGGNYFQTHTIQMGTDGFPKIMYNDYSTTPDDVHFINCLDANCSANTNTIVTTATGLYESSMALGSDGFGRLFFGDTVLGYRFIQCTNANCSTSVATIVDSNTNAYNVSLRMGIDDLPRLMYTTSAGTYYIRCLNAACSSKNTVTIKSSEGNPPDFDIDSEGLPHLVYTTNTQTQISYTKLLNETGFALISTPGSGLGTSTNPFGQIFANGVTLYENTYLVPTKGVLSIGSSAAAFDGSTSGYFTGSDYGTQIAVNAASGFSGNLMDLQVAGASKFKVTADGVVSFLGGLDLGNLTPRSVTRTLPVTVNDTVDIGSFTLTNGAATFDVSVTVASSGFSVSKNYSIPVQFNQTSGQWYSVMPTRSTNNHNGNDLALEINVNSATMSLRIRRIGGSTAGTAYITMLQQGVSNDTFTASTTTTTNAAVPTVTLDLFSDRLKVAGLQPGTVTSGNGVAAADVLNITAGAGGNTGTSPASTAGAGGAILLTLGAGGSPTAATTTANAGAGGAFTLQGGAGGSAAVAGTGTNTGGAGSTLTFNAGAGGAATGATSNTNTGGVGGAITLQAGVGGAATTGSGGLNGGTGGAVTITAGAGGVGSTSGAGGAVTISGGVGGVGTTTSGAGGAVTLQGGTAAAAVGAAGGAASLIGRAGSSTGSGGNGGAVTITAGAAGGDDSVSRSGGNIALIAGASKGNITGGGVTLTAGAASINPTVSGSVTGPQGGSMTLTVGAGGTAPNATTTSSGGAGGTFTLQGSAGGIASVSGSVNNTGGSGSTFNFNGGTGGAATGATNGTNTGGTGGGLAFTAGTGGAATTGSGTLLGGNGGTIFLIGGTGGTGTTGGAGGSITLQGGSAAASAGSAGGGITLTGRTGSSTGSGGAGGGININAGAAGGDDTVARAGGSVSISAGASKGNTAAGAITFNAGSGGQNLATGTASGPASGAFTITLATGGTAPNADVSSTGGAGGTFTIQNGTGGAASVAGTGNNTGGAGSSAAWTLGTGGAANGNTSGTNTGGSGGNFTLQAGTGGAASVGSGTLQGGVGGNISITAGTGGTGTAGGNGGSATLQGGGAAASAGSAGGGVNITGRTGSTTGTGGAGGGVTLTGGAAGGDNTVARAGGAITLTAGLSKGNQVGGGISLTTGAGGDNQTGVSVTGPSGGNFTLTLGSGGLASTATTAAVGGTAGTYTITGGAGGVAGVAGTGTNTGGVGSGFTWTAGAGGAASGATSGTNTGGAGGAITLTSGTGGAASAGSGTLQGGSGGLLTIGAGNGGAGNAGTGGTGANLVLQAGIGGSGTTAAGAGGVIRFLTGATTTLSERVRISNAGFVGIGTTNPSVMLDVAGDFKTGTAQTFSLSRTLPATIGATVELGTLTCNGNSANFTAYMSDSQAGGRYYEFLRNYDYPITGSNWEELLPTNTTGPRSNDTRLDVNIANQGTIILRLRNVVAVSATLGVVLKLEGGTCGFVSSSATATGATVTGLNATNIMTQYTGNKIGIGTATPSNLLHVVGTTNATGIQLQQTTTALTGTNNLLLVQSALADTTTGGLARFDQAGTGSTSAVVVINSASTSNAQTNANPSLSAGTASGLKVVTADDDAPSLLIRNTASSACVGQFTGCSGAVNAGGEGILTIEGNDNTNTTRYNLITAYNSNTRSAAAAVFRVRADGNVYGEAAFNATGADLAEYFETTDTSLEPGDVVVSDLNTEKVLKSKKQYADNLVGVISTAPAFVGNNPGGANDNKSNFKQVGLVGRLPIKVTTENGEIKPGDFLTSSKLFPGYAMKATRSGQIIGQALENFPIPELRGVSVVSEIESGKVLTFLKPGYQVINNTFTLEPEDGQLTSQLFKIETNNQDTALLVNQKGSGNLLTLQRDGTDSFIVKNNGSVYLSSNIQEVTLPVLNISNLDKKLFVVYANGNLEITGNIKVSKNSSGKAVLKLGDNRVKVKFTVPYPTTPNVFVTLTGLPPVTYSVIDKSPEGFTIVLAEPATSDRTFEWLAVEQPEATDSESILILDSVTPNADPQENNTPQSQVQNQIQDQEPSKPEAESEAKIPESIEAENNNSDILITE